MLTPRGSLGRLRLLAVQVLEELHGLPGHDDLLEDGLEEGHHGELPVAGALVASGAAAGHVAHFLLVLHRLGDAVQRVGGVPEVTVVHRDVLVPASVSLSVLGSAAHYRVGVYKKKRKEKYSGHIPLDDKLLGWVKQVAVNNPLVHNLQIRSHRLRPQ